MILNSEIKDLFEFDFNDFTLLDYKPDPAIKAEVSV
jgi:thymidylate synthase